MKSEKQIAQSFDALSRLNKLQALHLGLQLELGVLDELVPSYAMGNNLKHASDHLCRAVVFVEVELKRIRNAQLI